LRLSSKFHAAPSNAAVSGGDTGGGQHPATKQTRDTDGDLAAPPIKIHPQAKDKLVDMQSNNLLLIMVLR
jgi:hypothetical protein